MIQPHALYYAATLGFVFLDFALDVNLRAVFLDDFDTARTLYYLFLFICLVLVLRFPDLAVYIGTLESAIGVGALIVSFWIRFLLPGDPATGLGENLLSVREVINFLIVGLYGYYAYFTGVRQISRTKRR